MQRGALTLIDTRSTPLHTNLATVLAPVKHAARRYAVAFGHA